MLSYRKILKRSLDVSWENKYLWFFGLFALLLGAGGGFRFDKGEHKREMLYGGRMGETGVLSGDSMKNIFDNIFSNPISILIFIVFIALALFILWLSITSQGAIASHVAKIDSSKKKLDLTIQDGITTGNNRFWSIFWLNTITCIPLAIISAIIMSPAVLLSLNIGLSAVLYTVLFIIFVPLAISIILIFKYAINYVMVRDKSVKEAISSSWKLFCDNWMVSLEMAIILFLINFVAGLAILIFLAIASIPLLIIAIAFLNIFSFTVFYVVITIGVIILITIGILLSSFLYTFGLSSWTILFLRLEKGKGNSKLERLVEKKANKKTTKKKK